MRYSVGQLHLEAINQVMSGPDHLVSDLAKRLNLIKDTQSDYVDAQEFPVAEVDQRFGELPVFGTYEMTAFSKMGFFIKGLFKQFSKVPESAKVQPQLSVTTRPIRWIRVADSDSAIVISGDGQRATWVIRNHQTYFRLLRLQVKTYLKLYSRWKHLKTAYRAKALELCSIQTWKRVFEDET
jgi:galactofuranosylgalactofuranosylrhamnosyl-N-acetylglucosaminyl-diphospho-decaprenol beta-1,5/1,6-galactofuranosyltransferase